MKVVFTKHSETRLGREKGGAARQQEERGEIVWCSWMVVVIRAKRLVWIAIDRFAEITDVTVPSKQSAG